MTHFEARDPDTQYFQLPGKCLEQRNLDWGYADTIQTHPAAFKHKGLVIGTQLNVRPTARPGPANAHVSSGHHLKLKIPFSGSHRIRPLYPEKSDLVYADFLHSWVSYCEKEGSTECRR